MRSARFEFREEPEKPEEHRGSRMPDHISTVDEKALAGKIQRPGGEVRRAVRDIIGDLNHKTETGGARR